MSSVSDRDLVRAWGPWLVWIIVFALISALLPRDASFDVAHYHLHNGWSALNGRLEQDLAPAEMHSFLNPVFNVAVWWLIEHLPGPAVNAILGAFQAIAVPILYFLSLRLLKLCGVREARSVALVCAFAGFLCVPMLATMASLRNDMFGAIAFCAALLLLVDKEGEAVALRRLLVASFLVGLAAGVKLTNIVYIPGLAVFTLAAWSGVRLRAIATGVAAVGGLAGIVLGGGWWMAKLYAEFGNPVFPMLNDLFGASLGPEGVSRDIRYLPDSFLNALVRPVTGAFDLALINEDTGRDLRLAAFYLGAVAIIGLSLVQLRMRETVPRLVIAMALACLAFTIVWVLQFSIMRYATGAFLLGPLMLVLAWKLSPLEKALSVSARPFLYGMALLLIASLGPESVRRAPWGSAADPYLAVEVPTGIKTENAGVIMAGPFPTAFTAMAFEDAAWVAHGAVQTWSRPFLENYRPLITERINQDQIDLFAVICVQETGADGRTNQKKGVTEKNTAGQTLARLAGEYPVQADESACRQMETSFDTETTSWVICPLTRSSPAGPA